MFEESFSKCTHVCWYIFNNEVSLLRKLALILKRHVLLNIQLVLSESQQ